MPGKSKKRSKSSSGASPYNDITIVWRNSETDHLFRYWSIDEKGSLLIGDDLNDFPSEKLKIGPDVYYVSTGLGMADLHVPKLMVAISLNTSIRLLGCNLVFSLDAPKALTEWQKAHQVVS